MPSTTATKKKRNWSSAQAHIHLEQLAKQQSVAIVTIAKQQVAIEQAITIIVKKTGVTGPQAERIVAQRATEAGVKKHVVADAIIKSARKK